MGVYAVTGSASGMGAAVCERLRAAEHDVVTVDIRDADVIADLSTPAGRRTAVEKVLAASGGRLDGAVLAAGLGPAPGRERPALVTQVNYFGVVELLEGWRDALAAAGNAKVVVFGSNSATTMPLIPARAVAALLAGDSERALRTYRIFGRNAPTMAYGASKVAISRWVRRRAVEPEWVDAGIRLNAIAPGAVLTPLLEKQLATPGEARAIRAFPVPAGGYGDPGLLADWVIHMLSPAADFMVGSVVVVDGGSDAWFRADDWPGPVLARRLRGYLRKMREFRRVS
ncbi:MAG: SDR family oxidoreductase [Nocardioides sp.]|uniref:SDR family oxidoreductase n=1 Tax=Nocardioides sp. TaxID=35761 RepID=UPI003D6C69CB